MTSIMRRHLTLGGRNDAPDREVFVDDVVVGRVFCDSLAENWSAEDTYGRCHGDRYVSAWAAAKQLVLGIQLSEKMFPDEETAREYLEGI